MTSSTPPRVDTTEVAVRIRQARRLSGLSQQTLGTRLGVQRSAVSNWESKGATLPSIQNLIAIATWTGTSLDWLATGRGVMQPAEDLDRVPAADATFTETPQEKDLLMQFRRMPSRAQFLLLELLHTLSPKSRRQPLPGRLS